MAWLLWLFLLLLLFCLQCSFFLLRPGTDAIQPAKEGALAANFLNSVLGVTTGCYDRNIKELLQDCALSGVLQCPGDVNACLYSKQELQKMLDSSLGIWKKFYLFTVKGMPDELSIGSVCSGAKEYKQHPVVVRPGYDIMVTLEICGQ